MPYLSKIPVNPLRAAGQRLIASPQVTHASISQSFPTAEVGRTLWRLELTGTRAELLVLSQARPSWVQLVEDVGWPGADGGAPLVADLEPLLALIQTGREFAFRTRVNPVFRTTKPESDDVRRKLDAEAASRGRPRGARVPHRTAAQQTAWFLKRSTTWGFEVPTVDAGVGEPLPDLRLAARDRTEFVKRSDNSRRVTLATATFEGRLRVTDPEKMRASILTGIGPAKAYGCGLLTLAAARSKG